MNDEIQVEAVDLETTAREVLCRWASKNLLNPMTVLFKKTDGKLGFIRNLLPEDVAVNTVRRYYFSIAHVDSYTEYLNLSSLSFYDIEEMWKILNSLNIQKKLIPIEESIDVLLYEISCEHEGIAIDVDYDGIVFGAKYYSAEEMKNNMYSLRVKKILFDLYKLKLLPEDLEQMFRDSLLPYLRG